MAKYISIERLLIIFVRKHIKHLSLIIILTVLLIANVTTLIIKRVLDEWGDGELLVCRYSLSKMLKSELLYVKNIYCRKRRIA